MKRIKFMLLASAMLLAAPVFLTSCQENAPEINYTMNVSVINDFTKVVEAINNGSLKNEEAIKKLTEAIDKMNADQAAKLQAVIDVLNSANAKLETKLAAIEGTIKAQTLTLESKLALLETATKNQTIKQEEMADKLAIAIDNLGANMNEKLDALRDIIKSTAETQAEKLALIEAAMKAQTLTLEGKLDLIETAIKNLPDYTAQLEAIKAVIESLPDYGGKLDALAAAIKALPDYSAQLAAIKTAIEALPDYSDKLTALENAIKALPDYSDKFDAVVTALNAMKAQIEALGTSQADIATEIGKVTAAINALIAEVKSGNTSAAAALAQIVAKLEELKAAIGSGGGGGETPSTLEYVDLGLPSGVLWARKNLGAMGPFDYGDHYAWGETTPKADYSWATYKWWGTGGNMTKYNATDNNTILDPEDDAATANLGSPWRMPTPEEIDELRDNCTWTWTTRNGVNGYEVEGTNGNVIFLPAAGSRDGSVLNKIGSQCCYWSRSASKSFSDCASSLYFNSYDNTWYYASKRFLGYAVRPVRSKTPTSTEEYVDLGLPSGVKWAKRNLGASKPSDYGDYYAWGETQPNKAKYTWENYKWGAMGNMTKYNAKDGKKTLDPEDDVATDVLGSPWRMPTQKEFEELFDNCTWTWTTQDGVNGREFKGRNGNTIFLPAAGFRYDIKLNDAGDKGHYWSGSLNLVGNIYAYYLCFDSTPRAWPDTGPRCSGCTIRPVRP